MSKPITSSDMFLRSEGQQLDFTGGIVDVTEMFNNGVANVMNKLLIDIGVDDPIMEDIENNASDAKQAGLQSRQMIEGSQQEPNVSFGFENRQSPPVNPSIEDISNFDQDFTTSETKQTSEPLSSKSKPSSGSVMAQVTRYGFENDKYQNFTATSKGSKYENIGNRNNRLVDDVSVALPPKTARALGVNPKAGEFVEAKIGGKWQRFRVDDTAGNHKNHRIDFFDPRGKRVKIDGSNVELRKSR